MTTPELEPLAVYDVRESWPPPNLDEFLDWVRGHGINANDTYRIEIHEGPFARVFEYERNEDGSRPLDDTGRAPALRPPYDVPITCMPPEPSKEDADAIPDQPAEGDR